MSESLSPWKQSTARGEKSNGNDKGFMLHESEINIFQQLCLDKHDESAAIEILLDSSKRVPNLFTASNSGINDLESRLHFSPTKCEDTLEKQATFSTASGSTARGSGRSGLDERSSYSNSDRISRVLSRKKAGVVDAKRTFLDRFFSKSPRKSSPRGNDRGRSEEDLTFSPNENALPPQAKLVSENSPEEPLDLALDNASARLVFDESFRNQSLEHWSVPRSRYHTFGESVRRTEALVLSERCDSFSNVSSLSGSQATASIRAPIGFQRHQSLGVESIQDIRDCLKEMETQLAKASNKGQSVSRDKLMKALFTVAGSLEEDNERSDLKGELEHPNSNEFKCKSIPVPQDPPTHSGEGDCYTSKSSFSEEDDFTQDSSAFGGEEEENDTYPVDESSPFSIMSFLGVGSQDQQVIGEVFDDLFWGDFRASNHPYSRKNRYSRGKPRQARSSLSDSQGKRRMLALTAKNYNSESRRISESAKGIGEQPSKSWWRTQPSSQSSSEYDVDVIEEEEESNSSNSDEYPSYLPSSITVKKKLPEPAMERKASPTSFPRKTSSSSRYKISMQQQPQLVETESRLGFELGTIPRRTKLV